MSPRVPFVDTRRLHDPLRTDLMASFERVLDSGQYVQGGETAALEREFAAAYGSPHAVAVSNGTAALHLALLTAGVRRGDQVITVANTFIATAEAISLCGAEPVFVDIEPGGFNMDPASLEGAITRQTRAVILVHLYGQLASVEAIREVTSRRGIPLIEDACQAHGAFADGILAGTAGFIGCLSFYPTKNLGTVGEGGMLLTGDASVAERLASLRDHGQQGRHHHVEPGYNYRLSELQAAALRVFLPHMNAWNERRASAARRYLHGLQDIPGVTLPAEPRSGHVYHLFVIRSSRRDALKQHLEANGIGCAIHYPTPIHLQPAYAGAMRQPLSETERAASEILSLPMHPSISEEEIDIVCEAIRAFHSSPEPVSAAVSRGRDAS